MMIHRGLNRLPFLMTAVLFLVSPSAVSQEAGAPNTTVTMTVGGGSSGSGVQVHVGQGGVIGIGICVSDQCGAGGSYSGPLGSTTSPEFDRFREQAYRLSILQGYTTAVQEINASANQFLAQQRQAMKWSAEEFDANRNQFLTGLNLALPNLSATVPATPELRRVSNPMPDGLSGQVVDRVIEPVWESIRQSDLTRVADEVNSLMSSNLPLEGISEAYYQSQKAQYDFLKKELEMSQVIDENGLLNVPFVELPDVRLKTDEYTLPGREVRNAFNDHLAVSSTVNAYCQGARAASPLCKQAQDLQSLTDYGLLLLDEIASSTAWDSLLVQDLLSDLKVQIAFGKGVLAAGGDLAAGIAQMVAHPIDTAISIGQALIQYDKTWEALVNGVVSTWDEFEAGDETVKAEITGRVTFEVLSAFVPAAKVGSIAKRVNQSATLAKVAQKMARPVAALHEIGKGAKNQAVNFLRREMGRDWVSRLSTGQFRLSQGVYKFLDLESPINNPLPENGVYARVVRKSLAERIRKGEIPLSLVNDFNEVFITAFDDIDYITRPVDYAKRLGLYADKAGTKLLDTTEHTVLKFRFKSIDQISLRSPLEVLEKRGYRFIPGGRTSGNAREWFIDNDAFQRGLIEFID